MLRKTILLTIFVLIFQLFGEKSQRENTYFKFFAPSHVKTNQTFQTSIVYSFPEDSTESIEFFLTANLQFQIEKAELRTPGNFVPIIYENYTDELTREQGYRIKITKNQGIPFRPGGNFIIIFDIRGLNHYEITFTSWGITKKGRRSTKIQSEQGVDLEDKYKFTSKVKVYKPQERAGKLFQFTKNSQLSISFSEIKEERVIVETWINLSNPDQEILQIYNKATASTELILKSNKFQFLSLSDYKSDITFYRQQFVSLNSWYHLFIAFNNNQKRVSVFVNGRLIIQYVIKNANNIKDLEYSFLNKDEKNIKLDLLRVWKTGATVERFWKYMHFVTAGEDSSAILAQITFDNSNNLKFSKEIIITASEINYAVSDAPIFNSTPDLNVLYLGKTYLLEWNEAEGSNAENYILQRSTNGTDFTTVISYNALKNREKKYSHSDEITGDFKVIYYRILQRNSDGTTSFSNTVKIGAGDTETFIIHNNYPNPFNPKTIINLEIIEDTQAKVTVHDLEGKEIAVLHDGFIRKGQYQFSFDGEGLPSGIYLYSVSSPGFSQTKKMILAK